MQRDILFLLKPDFTDGQTNSSGEAIRFFCPDCLLVEGALSVFPQLRQHVDIRYVDFARPRQAIVALLGEAHQGCPVLVLAPGRTPPNGVVVGQVGDTSFIADGKGITRYWAERFSTSLPH